MNDNEEDMVYRIDIMLEHINKKRADLCSALNISKQSISSWKALKSYPSVDTAIKIANYLGVSIDWLLNGQLKQTDNKPSDIANYIIEREKQLLPTEYQEKVPLIEKIVSEEKFENWKNNRIEPTLDELIGVASALNITLDELLNLKLHKHDSSDEYYENRHLLKLAKEHNQFLMTYAAMYPTDQKYIDYVCRRLFKLRRQIEHRDFAYPIDPDNPKKQAEPDSDII